MAKKCKKYFFESVENDDRVVADFVTEFGEFPWEYAGWGGR